MEGLGEQNLGGFGKKKWKTTAPQIDLREIDFEISGTSEGVGGFGIAKQPLMLTPDE